MNCPKCGEREVFDETRYCGPCEEQYQREKKELDLWEKEAARRIALQHGEGCECTLCDRVFRRG